MARTSSPTQPTPLTAALRQTARGFAIAGAFSLFINLLVLVSPIFSMQVYDRVLSSGHVETLVMLTGIAGFALLIYGALDTIRSALLSAIGTWVERQLGGPLIEASIAASLAGQPSGAQPLRDLAQIRGFVGSQAVQPLFDAPWVPIFVVLLWHLHPWLGIMALVSAVLLFGIALANEALTRRPAALASNRQVAATKHADTALRNAEVVQAMGLLPNLLSRWERDNDEVIRLQQDVATRAGWLGGAAKFARLFIQTGILALAAYLVLKGEMTGGGMIAASILLGRALAPIEQSIGAWKQFVAARAGHGRLQKLLNTFPASRPAMALPAPRGQLTIDHLTFVPPGSAKPVLKQVSFQVPPGSMLAVLGASAAGKSTLCRLLVGVWQPTAGHVRLDAAEVHSWERTDFGRHVGYLPQDVELFPGTIRDNIARLGEADPQAVVEAARQAQVHEMILHLPQGYDTDIGETGALLSAGQKQRIGLARALYGAPKVLVLDEPNANLDQAGDLALLAALKAAKARGTTIVMVTHRPSLLAYVDKVLVLRDGEVERFGDVEDVRQHLAGPRPQVVPPTAPSRPMAVSRAAAGAAE